VREPRCRSRGEVRRLSKGAAAYLQCRNDQAVVAHPGRDRLCDEFTQPTGVFVPCVRDLDSGTLNQHAPAPAALRIGVINLKSCGMKRSARQLGPWTGTDDNCGIREGVIDRKNHRPALVSKDHPTECVVSQ